MLNDLLIDKRIVQRHIKQGKVDAAEFRRMLEALPDLSAKLWRREQEPAAAVAAPAPTPAEPRIEWPEESAPARYQPAPP
jgi:hypothetical protein